MQWLRHLRVSYQRLLRPYPSDAVFELSGRGRNNPRVFPVGLVTSGVNQIHP
jgi:hypothetical protein